MWSRAGINLFSVLPCIRKGKKCKEGPWKQRNPAQLNNKKSNEWTIQNFTRIVIIQILNVFFAITYFRFGIYSSSLFCGIWLYIMEISKIKRNGMGLGWESFSLLFISVVRVALARCKGKLRKFEILSQVIWYMVDWPSILSLALSRTREMI